MKRSQRKLTSPDVGILANRALRTVQRELFLTLSGEGHSDLRPRHGAVLAFLDETGSRATDLSRQSGQHKQVIGTLVDELVELGYVRRESDPDDRRAKLVVPTERGLDEMRRSDAIVADIEARHARAVGAEAYEIFKTVLRRVAEGESTTAEGESAASEGESATSA